MHFEEDYFYHVYNRANETVFYSDKNYLFFIEKLRAHIYPVCYIIAWWLMPNHFHLLVKTNHQSVQPSGEKHRPGLSVLSKSFGTLLSSYTQALNKERERRGSIFSHKTKAK